MLQRISFVHSEAREQKKKNVQYVTHFTINMHYQSDNRTHLYTKVCLFIGIFFYDRTIKTSQHNKK